MNEWETVEQGLKKPHTYRLLDGKNVSAYRVEDRLGLTAEPAVMWVDRQGRLLRVRTGPIDMILTDKSRIDLLYATRRAEAETQLKQLIEAVRTR